MAARTYTEAQYGTDSARAMLRRWVDQHGGDREAVARYLSKTLRVGGIKACRELVAAAVEEIEVER